MTAKHKYICLHASYSASTEYRIVYSKLKTDIGIKIPDLTHIATYHLIDYLHESNTKSHSKQKTTNQNNT